MFVDELEISAKAGNGGHGVVRWLRQRYRPKGGPAGGNGGKGGDVYMRAVRDLSLLSKYTGSNDFNFTLEINNSLTPIPQIAKRVNFTNAIFSIRVYF